MLCNHLHDWFTFFIPYPYYIEYFGKSHMNQKFLSDFSYVCHKICYKQTIQSISAVTQNLSNTVMKDQIRVPVAHCPVAIDQNEVSAAEIVQK